MSIEMAEKTYDLDAWTLAKEVAEAQHLGPTAVAHALGRYRHRLGVPRLRYSSGLATLVLGRAKMIASKRVVRRERRETTTLVPMIARWPELSRDPHTKERIHGYWMRRAVDELCALNGTI
jgi:hypothetical protein